jgi:hypothetical protein
MPPQRLHKSLPPSGSSKRISLQWEKAYLVGSAFVIVLYDLYNHYLSLSSSWTHLIRNSFIDQLSLCVPQDIWKISYLDERIKLTKMTQNSSCMSFISIMCLGTFWNCKMFCFKAFLLGCWQKPYLNSLNVPQRPFLGPKTLRDKTLMSFLIWDFMNIETLAI